MIINLSPQRRDDSLTIIKLGDALNINGVDFDFSAVPEGGVLPQSAVDCEFLASDVTRTAGQIVLTLLLPHGPDASEAARFPQPITPADGPVELPV